jgi:hypothetical protein
VDHTEPAPLAERLASDAEGDWGAEAAIWLLTQHGHWLPELERASLLIRMSPNSDTWVRIDWARVAAEVLLRHEGLIGTASEWQILAAASSLTGRHALSWADLPSLDDRNKRLVLHAVAWAAGGREWAESLGLLGDKPDEAGDAPDELTRLRERVAELEADSALLGALEAAGVDDWEGYGEAMRALHDEG